MRQCNNICLKAFWQSKPVTSGSHSHYYNIITMKLTLINVHKKKGNGFLRLGLIYEIRTEPISVYKCY